MRYSTTYLQDVAETTEKTTMPEETFGRHVVKYYLFPGPRVCVALAHSRLGRSGKLGIKE